MFRGKGLLFISTDSLWMGKDSWFICKGLLFISVDSLLCGTDSLLWLWVDKDSFLFVGKNSLLLFFSLWGMDLSVEREVRVSVVAERGFS